MLSNNELRKWCKERTGCDTVRIKKNGEVWFEYNYYYRHGMDAHKFADRITPKLTERLVFDRAEDRWGAWPKRSYFLAVFRRK